MAEASLVTMTFRGEVIDLKTESSAGVTEMCLRDYEVLDCGQDDGSGYNMQVPQNIDFLMDLSNPGYPPHLLQARGLAATSYDVPMMDQAGLDALAEVTGTTITDGKGVVLLYISDGSNGLLGATANLVGSGSDPVYYSNLTSPDPDLPNTSPGGFVAWGGVQPGNYSLSLDYPDALCGSFYRGVNEDGIFDVTVEAGTVTFIGEFECSDSIGGGSSGSDETG